MQPAAAPWTPGRKGFSMIHNRRFFTDPPDGHTFRIHPLDVVRAANRNVATDAIPGSNLTPQSEFNDAWEQPGADREVIYRDDANGILQRLTLRLVEHNGGAWTDLDDATPATLAGQFGSPEGRIVASDGTMSAVREEIWEVKGCLFGEYFEDFQGRNRAQPTPVPVTALANGDWYWTIVDGPYQFRAAEAIAVGEMLGLGAIAQFGQVQIFDSSVITEDQCIIAQAITAAAGVDVLFNGRLNGSLKAGGFRPNEF